MSPAEREDLISKLRDINWRLENLYWITDENAQKIRFVPNEYQRELLKNLWYNNVVLKSRQLGFTTFISILFLDIALFNPEHQLGVIAHTLDDVEKIFRTKIKYAVENLHPFILEMVGGIRTQNASSIEFGNGSKVSVGVSMRGGTLQGLHVSEMGKIAAKFPEKAREIVTGSFPAVHKGNFIFVESTAEGAEGEFYRICKQAMDLKARNVKLTEQDFRFHFFPWWRDPKCAINTECEIPSEMSQYFEDLKGRGINLTPNQRWWYSVKWQTLQDDMKREYPSYEQEAFEQAVIGAYYHREMAWLRANGHMKPRIYVPNQPVYTFWDLGRNDMNAIWFMQDIAGEFRFIDYYESTGEALDHYARILQNKGYIYGQHYLPHDANNVSLERGESRVDRLVELGIPHHQITVVERVEDINVGIEMTRSVLTRCWFDSELCSIGLSHLDGYRKEWSDRLGTFLSKPRHDIHSNGADAFRQFAQGYQQRKASKPVKRTGSWRVA